MAWLNSLFEEMDPPVPPVDLPPAPGPGPTQGGDLGGGGYSDVRSPLGRGGRGGGASGPGPRPTFNFGQVPRFVPPDFTAPSFDDAMNEPGYQFRLQSGRDALERSAAARGVLRTGGTLQDIVEYGQNFGAQEYGNVYNRALQLYNIRSQNARDAFAPLLAQWRLLSEAEMAAGLAGFQNDTRGGGGGGGDDIPPPPGWQLPNGNGGGYDDLPFPDDFLTDNYY